jgi:hypothetical protein
MSNGKKRRGASREATRLQAEALDGRLLDSAPAGLERFEGWLLRRVRAAVAAGAVPPILLREIEAELAAPQATPRGVRHPVAIRLIAELARVPPATAADLLATLERKSPWKLEPLLQRIADTWLCHRQGSPPLQWRVQLS